jgi:uncharacterized surface protein with fasciclin (FAS1) repeats
MKKTKRSFRMKKHKIFLHTAFFTGILLFLLFPSGCKEDISEARFYEDETRSIADYIESNEDVFSRFQQVMKTGELETTLKSYNPEGNNYTLFLPTDEAFDRFVENSNDYASFNELLDDTDYLKSLVRYHVLNMGLERNDFPYGILPDTTLSGNALTVGFTTGIDSTVVKINNYATILRFNIELSNGYIHVIDEVLEPIVYSSYEWLEQRPDYSIFSEALEITGLKDTFKIKSSETEIEYPKNTLLVESDEVFNKHGIQSIDDLKEKYSPNRQDYAAQSNGLFQFVAYHILIGSHFLNNFEGKNTNYNTYATFPISLNALGLEMLINKGAANFDTIINGNDTTIIDFVQINYDESNVLTRNGTIHFIMDVMEPYRPKPRAQTFEFYEEELISRWEKAPGDYEFNDPSRFEVISWEGVEEVKYVKSASNLSGIWNNDYLEIDGDFIITYEMPKLLPGKYMLQIKANDEYYNNATIQVYLDGERIGGNVDLTENPNKWSSMNLYNIGQRNFTEFETHQLRIRSLIAGRFMWDGVRFEPIN